MHRPKLDSQDRLVKTASYVAVAVAGILLITKAMAYYKTNSVGVLGALVDSFTDIAASIINLLAIKYALKPADEEHRFGHGKMESLAGLGQSLFIFGSAIYLAFASIDRYVNPSTIQHLEWGFGIALFSFFLTLLLVFFQRHVVKKTGSQAIKADSLHYFSDLIANFALFISFILYGMGWVWMDPIVGLAAAGFIMKSAYEIGHESFQTLLDQEVSDELREEITDLALAYKNVGGIHDLKTRSSGRQKFIQFHLEIKGSLSLFEAHEIVENIEQDIIKRYPKTEVIIHEDPF